MWCLTSRESLEVMDAYSVGRSPNQVDNDLLEFHQVSGCAGSYRILADADHQTTASVVFCAAVVSVPTHSVKTSDPGRALFPGSAPRQLCSAPRCLQARGVL